MTVRALAETRWPRAPRARLRGEIIDYEPGMSVSEPGPGDVELGRLEPEGCPACASELIVSGHRVVCTSDGCGYRTTTGVHRIG